MLWWKSSLTFLLLLLIGFTSSQVSNDVDKVNFYVYTDRSDTSSRQRIIYNSTTKILPDKLINASNPTVVYIHGFMTAKLFVLNNPIVDAYFKSPYNVNFLVLDWGDLSNPEGSVINMAIGYPIIVQQNVEQVGRRLGEFVLWLHKANFIPNLDNLHFIGHSLGSHVSGIGAGTVSDATGKKVGRITGLDPAGPLYQWPFNQRHLTKNDASFVDSLHTNAGVLGTTLSEAHVDVWVNGGSSQIPTCLLSIPAPEPICSHNYAQIVYSYSINNRLTACKRGSSLALLGNGTDPFCNEPLVLGPSIDKKARGIYDLQAFVVAKSSLTARESGGDDYYGFSYP